MYRCQAFLLETDMRIDMLFKRDHRARGLPAIQKTLLKDGSLVLRLEGEDLAGAAHFDGQSDFGSHTIMQTNLMDTQRVKISVRYNFNTATSKYRGTGAGRDSKKQNVSRQLNSRPVVERLLGAALYD